jgi:hypothetical protein
LSILAVSGASGGSVTRALNGDVLFTASSSFAGTASFQYTVADGHLGSDRGQVSILVTSPAQPHAVSAVNAPTFSASAFVGADTLVFAPTLKGVGGLTAEQSSMHVPSLWTLDVWPSIPHDGHDTARALEHPADLGLNADHHAHLTSVHDWIL